MLAFFGDTRFMWHVGPSSRPTDLEALLLAHGLALGERPRLMTAPLPLPGEWREADIRIVEVTDRATARVGLKLAHHTDDLDRALDDRMRYLAFPGRTTHFLI